MFDPDMQSMNSTAVPAVLSAAGASRRLEARSGQVTIAHGLLPGPGLGTMTTAFRVRDPAMLQSIAAGQRVRFASERAGGLHSLIRLEAAP